MSMSQFTVHSLSTCSDPHLVPMTYSQQAMPSYSRQDAGNLGRLKVTICQVCVLITSESVPSNCIIIIQIHVHCMVYECVQCMCTCSSNSSQPMATTYSKFGTLPVQGIAIAFLCTTMNLLLSYEYSPEGSICQHDIVYVNCICDRACICTCAAVTLYPRLSIVLQARLFCA